MIRILILTAVFAVFGTAQDRPDPVTAEFAGDYFAAGSAVRIQTPVEGDLIAAGGNVSVRAEVGGDAVAAGGDVRIESPIKQGGVYAAGGRVMLNSEVARNVRLAGGSVEVGPQAKIHGNASLGGGQIEVTGAVDGYVQAAGSNVYLNGPVTGDVHVTARDLELGPNARISGKLQYRTQAELKRDAAAVVGGGVERLSSPARTLPDTAVESTLARGMGIAWMLGLMVLAAFLVGTMPAAADRITASVAARPWTDIALGFVGLVCIPFAIILLFVTVVGLPLGLLLVLGYLALLLIGYVVAGIAVGEIVLKWVQPAHASQRSWKIGAAGLGVLIVMLLSGIPLLGWLIAFLALLMGIGAVLSQLRRKRPDMIASAEA